MPYKHRKPHLDLLKVSNPEKIVKTIWLILTLKIKEKGFTSENIEKIVQHFKLKNSTTRSLRMGYTNFINLKFM